jgi:hypothetical protein
MIDIAPAQRQQFAASHSRSESERNDRVKGAATKALQNLLRLFDANDLDLARLPQSIDGCGGVVAVIAQSGSHREAT